MNYLGVRLVCLSLLALGFTAACAKRVPDADATPAGANPLALDAPTRDALDCRRDDCTDWYRLEVPAKGRLVVDLSVDPTDGTDARISLSLASADGATLARDQTLGRQAIVLAAEVTPANYLIAVASSHPTARFDYTVSARLVLPPPPRVVAPPPRRAAPPKPAPPRFETRLADVLEVDEDGPHGRAVLLDAGAAQGLRAGLRGRLLDGGRAIGTLEIVEVYPEGSLARVDGAAAGSIGASSTAEIDIPLDPPPTKP